MEPRGTAEELASQQRRLLHGQRLLFDVAARLGPALELTRVLDIALQAMQELVDDVKGGSIVLLDDRDLRIAVASPAVSADVMDMRLPVERGLSGHVVRTRQPYRTADLATDPLLDAEAASIGSNSTIVSWLGVPLVVLGECIGLLQVDSAERDAFDEVDETMLAGFGTLVAGAIESARRYEQVLELEQLKSDFLERVSHELRTPIAILQGFSSTLTAVGETMEQDVRDTVLERIGAASDRLAYLVEEVLTVTSLDGGVARPQVQQLELATVVQAARRGVVGGEDITVDVPEGLVVNSDPALLRQVLSPLLDNAVKYGSEARIEAQRDGAQVVVRVRDRGDGVDPRIEPRLFDRFVRGRHTVEGMGLGLAISRHLAAGLHATVDLVPEDGQTCFEVRLPADGPGVV